MSYWRQILIQPDNKSQIPKKITVEFENMTHRNKICNIENSTLHNVKYVKNLDIDLQYVKIISILNPEIILPTLPQITRIILATVK